MSEMYILGLLVVLVVLSVVEARPQITLEYQPMRPPHHPRPSGTYPSQIIPPGDPWPDNAQGYQNLSQVPSIVDRTKEMQTGNKPTSSSASSGFLWPSDTEDEQINFTKPPPKATSKITLEYQPTRPPHHPKPGNDIQPDDYPTTIAPVIVDRIKEDSLQASTPTSQQQTPISLGYKPTRPFYHPNPGNNINQIVPPGEPWPNSPEGYQNFSQIENSPNLPNRIKETTSPGKTTTTKSPQDTISLEYQPNRPFFHPNPGNNINQIVPPGEPWPSSPEGYKNFSQIEGSSDLVNRIKDVTPPSTSTTTKKQDQTINLEYQPNRPSFHPSPGNNINQVVPPGKPWPNSPEGYQNFSQVSSSNLVNRGQEVNSFSTERSSTQMTNSNKKQQQLPASLEYQPNRPFHQSRPGNTLDQIISPGKPWPDSPQGYQNFSEIVPVLNIQDRVKETQQSSTVQTPTANDTPISLGIIQPGQPWPDSPDKQQNFGQSTAFPDLLSLLKDHVDKKKAMEKAKPTESGFIWNIEAKSEKNLTQSEQPEPETTNRTEFPVESSISETSSQETLTADVDTSTLKTGILSEERLYTSAPLETMSKDGKKIRLRKLL